jgi:hypothetical protein
MHPKNGKPAGGAAGSDMSLLGGCDAWENSPTLPKPQRLSATDRVQRELLLDAIDEGADDVIAYAEAVRRFVFERDRASLFPAINGLVVKAWAVGAACIDLRKLVGGGS